MSLVTDNKFWELENDAPLIARLNGFITPETSAEACERASAWMDYVPADAKSKYAEQAQRRPTSVDSAEMNRIFYQDAVRTFTTEDFRKLEVTCLCACYQTIQDYHQGLGFIIAFLLLFLKEADVITMALYLNEGPLKGYFKLHNHDYLRDARVFEQLLLQTDPQLGKQLTHFTTPGAYCSKWWIGMNLHVLPFESLFRWWELLLSKGPLILFKYGLSIMQKNRDFLMKANSTAKIAELLRFDKFAYPDTLKANAESCNAMVDASKSGSYFLDIVENALEISSFDEDDVERLRAEIAEEMVKEELARQKYNEEHQDSEDDEMFSSDEEDGEEKEGEK